MPNELTAILPANPNELPSSWVAALFARFSAMYGKHWLDMWADVPIADVKDAWQSGLAGMSGDAIKRALAHCETHNKFPPTLPEFAALCREFRPVPAGLALPAPRAKMTNEQRDMLARAKAMLQ